MYDTQENSFSFVLFSKEDILKAIKSLSSNKTSPIENISIKNFKNLIHVDSEKLFSKFSTNIFNKCLISRKFLDTLKIAHVTLIFKKESNKEKESYCLVTMLSTFSKVFEELFEQINDHMQSKFSKRLAGFCKKFSAQNALLVKTEKWKTISNKNLKVTALFIDL